MERFPSCLVAQGRKEPLYGLAAPWRCLVTNEIFMELFNMIFTGIITENMADFPNHISDI